jgi:hypothetical protein
MAILLIKVKFNTIKWSPEDEPCTFVSENKGVKDIDINTDSNMRIAQERLEKLAEQSAKLKNLIDFANERYKLAEGT